MRNSLDTLLETKTYTGRKIIRWIVMLLLTIFGVWAFYTDLDEVAVASGEVVPQGELKVVQHFEGGVIDELLVQEGDFVEEGQVLLKLNLAGSALNLDELKVRIDGLLLRKQRVQAQINGKPFMPDESLSVLYPNLATSEINTFHAEQAAHDGTILLIEQKIKQKELEVEELVTHLETVQQDLSFTSQRLEMSQTLIVDGLMSKIEHLQISSEAEKLRGQANVLQKSIPRARSAVDEAKAERSEAQLKRQARLSNVLIETETAIASVQETLDLATDQSQRADVRSPINGTVKNIRHNTIGGVVRPGEAILEIVPAGDDLLIKAELSPVDRGYVEVGQNAVVKISTYDFARYGGLEGEVVRISASTNTTQDGIPFYDVIVRTNKTYLGNEGEYPISPGMQATVDIHTGTRTVFDYLIRPVLKLKHEGFRER
ncbi:HlyD family type I secretion periplasmic adaptor subunit [Curvivirga aplysinae]|uniref:HlyD family type I secretion periplasmic adaptor subunit n=1 Tax=Curvivirga aplysinae TaxID=2529852 RepID=UPI0012BBE961|nr:HlyD family type I secretion periplasmic adaptor subunit [Curvivirga aplysinae]MTI09560.1 HlyD family type I secretion periplasmic adaptor subunit [Curvivirga aplysinae]